MSCTEILRNWQATLETDKMCHSYRIGWFRSGKKNTLYEFPRVLFNKPGSIWERKVRKVWNLNATCLIYKEKRKEKKETVTGTTEFRASTC